MHARAHLHRSTKAFPAPEARRVILRLVRSDAHGSIALPITWGGPVLTFTPASDRPGEADADIRANDGGKDGRMAYPVCQLSPILAADSKRPVVELLPRGKTIAYSIDRSAR